MRLHRSFSLDELEPRLLLTVKVAFNDNSGLLKITGDNADNNIDVIGTGVSGTVEVFDDDTLVNTFTGVKNIKISSKGGDDDIQVAALKIPGNLTLNLGDGADQFDLDNTADEGASPDGDVQIGGDIKAAFGGDEGDFADWDSDGTGDFELQIARNVTLEGAAFVDLSGDGGTELSEPTDIFILGNFNVNLSGQGNSNGSFEVDLDDLVVTGNTTLLGSNSVERVRLIDNTFVESFTINLDDGNDTLEMNDNGALNNNAFVGPSFLRGGDDNDTLELGTDNIFGVVPVITGFESIT